MLTLLGENIGVNLCDLGLDNGLLDMTSETYDKISASEGATKSKKDNQPTEWVKIFDKGLVFQIYKQHFHVNNKNTDHPVEKWAKGLNSHFSKEDAQMTPKHRQSSSTSVISREMMQLKTTVRHQLTPTRSVRTQKTDNT